MLITREMDYAIRILRALSDGKQVKAEDICEEELLPRQFAYKILKKMEQAGFVGIARGSGGGCRLIADLGKMNLYNLVETLKAEHSISACVQPGFQCPWQQMNDSECRVHRQLQQIQDMLDDELRKRILDRILSEDS